ncbi:MAG: FMN-binding glutamate synthase family protein, partial [Candidatus Puniceispirillaceae bacterium]
MEFLFGRYSLMFYALLGALAAGLASLAYPAFWGFAAVLAGLAGVGFYDYTQKKRAVLGNYPLIGRFRFLFESIRPELRQYFWESDTDELPYSRNQRAMAYQRAKSITAARPFGSDKDMYAEDFNWLNHSLQPAEIDSSDFRIRVGKGDKAYDASVLNISGTSFGALSPPA